MSKLGIAFKTTSLGAGNPIVVNDGPWKSRVVDIRDYLKHCPALANDHNKFVTFMLFSQAGAYVVTARTISGRPWDNTAGWIFIPWSVSISGAQVMELLGHIRNLLLQPMLPDQATLNRTFSYDYPSVSIADAIQPSVTQGPFAVRSTMSTPVETLLGPERAQPYYSSFVAVFIDNDPSAFSDVTNISGQPLVVKTGLNPPAVKDIVAHFGQHVSILYSLDGKTFTDFMQPILVPVGSLIKLRLARPGFEGVNIDMNVLSKQSNVPLNQIKVPTWYKKISANDFVINKEGKSNLIPSIKINGTNLANRYLDIAEKDLGDVKVKVSCPEYEDFEKSFDLTTQQLPIRITLHRTVENYERDIYLSNDAKAHVIIQGRDIPRNGCPLEGYKNYNGVLEYSPAPRWLDWIIGGAAGVILALVGVLVYNWITEDNTQKTTHETEYTVTDTQTGEQADGQEGEQANKEDKVDDPDNVVADDDNAKLTEALDYLDSQPVWKREEMEKIEGLKGLWDAINSLKAENFKEFKELVDKSPKLSEIHSAIVEAHKDGTYIKDQSTSITVANFVTNLNKAKSSPGASMTSKNGKKARPDVADGHANDVNKPTGRRP